MCILSTFLLFAVILPLGITALEYNHYWTKLFNFGAAFVNKVLKTSIQPIAYKSGPNSMDHELRTLKKWTIIGVIVAVVLIVLKLIFKIF